MIVTRIQALTTFGIPNAADVAALENRFGLQLTLDPAAIQRCADGFKGLLYEVTLPVPPAFYDLPTTQQEGLKMVGRAMQLLTVPHRLQSNTYGATFEQLVMETPAYTPLRPYYIRFAGPFNFLQPDRNNQPPCFLPGWEGVTRPPGGGMYPPEITTVDEFRRFVPEGSDWDRQQRHIFQWKEPGSLAAIPYSQVFQQWLSPAADLLEGAAELFAANAPQVAAYLRSAAIAFRINDFASNDRAWVGLTEGVLDMNIGAVEQYMDKIRGWMAQFLGVIQIKDAEKEASLAALKAAYPHFEENLPVEGVFKKPLAQRVPPPVFVVDNLFATAHQNAGGHIGIAYNRPNDMAVREAVGRRIVIMSNLVKTREAGNPAGERLMQIGIHPSQRGLITARAMTLFVFFHEEAHGNGREHLVVNPTRDATKALGPLGSSAEELRADVVGLHNAKTAVTLGLIPQRLLKEIYVTYLYRCLGTLRKGTSGAHVQGIVVTLNCLLEAGALSIDRDGMTLVHLKKMPQAVAELAAQLIRIKGYGNQQALTDLYQRFGTAIPQRLIPLYQALEGLPLDLIVHYEFEDLLAG